MKSKFTNELNMFLALKNHMHKNEKIWESVKEIGRALNKFNSNLEQIQDLETGSDLNINDLDYKKEISRKALIKEARPILNILKVFVKENKEKSLSKKVYSKNKKIENLKDGKLLDYCKMLRKESRKLYNKAISGNSKSKLHVQENDSILNYGLSVAMIDNLEEENMSFEMAHLAYREAKSQKDKIEKAFDVLNKKNNDLLKNKLDLLVSIFKTSNPDFYKNYQSARKVKQESKVSIERTRKPEPVKTKTRTKKVVAAKVLEVKKASPSIAEEKAPLEKKKATSRKPRAKAVASTEKTAAPAIETKVSGKTRTTGAVKSKGTRSQGAPRKPRTKVIKTTPEQSTETEKA